MSWEDNLEWYDNIVNQWDRFERKGKTMPYTSANGHMFSLLNKAGEFGIRFSKAVQETYIKEWNSDYFKSYGATMKGYVLIPTEMFKDEEKMIALLNESYDYVMSLEPK